MSDSDSETKHPGVPAWQLKGDEEQSSESQATAIEPLSRTAILEQARKFLEEDDVKNASTDKKIAFLESKGLEGDDIQELLGVSRNDEATNTSITEVKSPDPKTQPQLLPRNSSPSTPTNYAQIPRDQAPIITYPEFLVQPSASTPLITKHRLLTTLYLFGSLSFLLHGTNTFLIRPMLNTLTESRLSLSSATLNNLQKLIHKLENTVSEIPPTYHHHKPLQPEYLDSDAGSVTSDPTELFHRDIGVQTSLPSSPLQTPSSPSLISHANTATTATTIQTSRLTTLQGTLSSLLEDSTYESSTSEELETKMSILKEYLQGLVFSTPTFSYGSGGFGSGDRNGNNKEGEDEIAKVKKEIRGVKGVLLSARSFPGGVRAR
ncbi:putative peroxin 14 17 protein [Botrytis fragariae]|uniref:Peroxisomal membrane protein PEX14 n=1 Tax=Botrytis fragariae TaxID=1964551 RepID=A0A8H6AKI8_9HELO|nr:putative peroxin 14 17 protein [Botrytis fragariae]KAF5869306.1 putative peroxin 14 17 protein [Botrytis fragariae]